MIKVGEMVKIEDIGVLAKCIRIDGNEVQLELCGERFWIVKNLCQPVISMEEMEAAA